MIALQLRHDAALKTRCDRDELTGRLTDSRGPCRSNRRSPFIDVRQAGYHRVGESLQRFLYHPERDKNRSVRSGDPAHVSFTDEPYGGRHRAHECPG